MDTFDAAKYDLPTKFEELKKILADPNVRLEDLQELQSVHPPGGHHVPGTNYCWRYSNGHKVFCEYNEELGGCGADSRTCFPASEAKLQARLKPAR